MSAQVRADFEAWYAIKSQGWPEKITVACKETMFEPWEQSRKAQMITLPNRFDEKYQEYFDDVEGGSFNAAKYLSDVDAVLKAAGLTVVS